MILGMLPNIFKTKYHFGIIVWNKYLASACHNKHSISGSIHVSLPFPLTGKPSSDLARSVSSLKCHLQCSPAKLQISLLFHSFSAFPRDFTSSFTTVIAVLQLLACLCMWLEYELLEYNVQCIVCSTWNP